MKASVLSKSCLIPLWLQSLQSTDLAPASTSSGARVHLTRLTLPSFEAPCYLKKWCCLWLKWFCQRCSRRYLCVSRGWVWSGVAFFDATQLYSCHLLELSYVSAFALVWALCFRLWSGTARPTPLDIRPVWPEGRIKYPLPPGLTHSSAFCVDVSAFASLAFSQARGWRLLRPLSA